MYAVLVLTNSTRSLEFMYVYETYQDAMNELDNLQDKYNDDEYNDDEYYMVVDLKSLHVSSKSLFNKALDDSTRYQGE